jgi:type III restriction enzyme
MSNPFFDHPILNSPYEYPRRHWELDDSGQPTQNILERRRRAEFITPIPKPKKRKSSAQQSEIVFDEGKGISTKEQQYDPTSIINEVRKNVDLWRNLPNPNQWQVTPETVRLLQHWRLHKFSGVRPFFCQIEAIETAIWLTEVAPHSKTGKRPSGDREQGGQSRTHALCVEAGHRCGEDHGDGHDHCMADD